MGVPGDTTWPSSTCRMPRRPSNGARIVFFAMVARRFATAASACWRAPGPRRGRPGCWPRPCAQVRGALEADLRQRGVGRAPPRAAPPRWRCRAARAPRPSSPPAPDSKPISRTTPVSSAPSVTPRAATSVPMAVLLDGQSISSTAAAVTDSGGGRKALPAWIMARICATLTAASAPTTTSSARTATAHTLVFGFMRRLLPRKRARASPETHPGPPGRRRSRRRAGARPRSPRSFALGEPALGGGVEQPEDPLHPRHGQRRVTGDLLRQRQRGRLGLLRKHTSQPATQAPPPPPRAPCRPSPPHSCPNRHSSHQACSIDQQPHLRNHHSRFAVTVGQAATVEPRRRGSPRRQPVRPQ